MIQLTRLNGHTMLLNCDLIRYAEAAPDTVLTLITGEKLVVSDTTEEIRERTLAYRAEVLRAAWPDAAEALQVRAALHAFEQDKQHQS
jgi:flagellar protein FlbD